MKRELKLPVKKTFLQATISKSRTKYFKEGICITLPHCVFIAGLANVLSRMATGSNAVEQGCTWTKAWLEFTVNRELEL